MYYLRAPDVETRQKWVVGLEAVKVSIYVFYLWEISYKCVVVLCGYSKYTWHGGVWWSFIMQTQQNTWAWNFRAKKKYLASKFLTQKRLQYLDMDSSNQTYSSNLHQFELSYFEFPFTWIYPSVINYQLFWILAMLNFFSVRLQSLAMVQSQV